MTANGIISKKYDHFRLLAQRKKVVRLILKPLLDYMSEFENVVDRKKLIRDLDDHIGAVESLEADGKWFDGFEAAVDALLNLLPERSRGSPGLFQEPDDARVALDPRLSEKAFLYYIMGEFIQCALLNKIMVCVAQNGRQLSIVPSTEFSDSAAEETFPIPAEFDPFPIEKFTTHWCEELGADRLWFAVSSELERDFGEVLPVDRLDSEKTTNTRQSSGSLRGHKTDDKPFVDLAFNLLESGQAKNAHAAMRLLEDGLWKKVAPEAKSFDQAVLGGGTLKSRSARLYNQLNDRWKQHVENIS